MSGYEIGLFSRLWTARYSMEVDYKMPAVDFVMSDLLQTADQHRRILDTLVKIGEVKTSRRLCIELLGPRLILVRSRICCRCYRGFTDDTFDTRPYSMHGMPWAKGEM
jgi:hypothetical protein